MTLFILFAGLATILVLGVFLFVKRRPSWRYRGALWILLSWLYFSVIFLIAALTVKDP
jgi:hypothetical protein